MATWVTSPIHEGKPITLRELALRGLEITVLGRFLDGQPLPEKFRPDSEFERRVEVTRRDLARLETRSMEQAQLEYEKWRSSTRKRVAESVVRLIEERRRYDEMLAKVKNWEVPPVLADFKALLQQQLEESREFDCEHDLRGDSLEEDFDTWRANQILVARDGLDLAERSLAAELEHVQRMNEFADAFRAALPTEGADDQPVK